MLDRLPVHTKASKAVFQSMVEKAGDGIFVYQDHAFFYVNPAFEKIAGLSARDLEKMSIKDIVHPSMASLIEDRYERYGTGEYISGRFDVSFLTRGKRQRNISLYPTVINLGGRPATITVARDITESMVVLKDLESSNLFLNGLIEGSSDAIVAVDLQGNVLIFNKSAERITGYSAKEMLKSHSSVWRFMKESEWRRIVSLLDKGNAEEPCSLIAEETSLYLKDGTSIPISLSASYIYQNEKPVAGVSIFRDLRPMKVVQERLRESEQKYRMLVEKANDGIFVYQDHRFRYTNPRFRQLLGYSEDELSNMGLKDIVRHELADLIEGRYAKRIRGEKVPEQYEIALLGNDDIWRAFEITPSVIEYEGKIATQNIIRDITQKRLAQKALRASEAKYRATVEHTGTAMMIFEEDFTISLVNRQMERLSGYKREEIEQKKWTELVHADDLERMIGYHKARRRGEKVPSEYEFHYLNKDGSIRDSFITIGLIPGTRQSIVSLVDITDKKQMEREIEKSRKMALLGEMSAHVAHEVRNPLQKIKMGVELLVPSLTLDTRQKRLMDGVVGGISNLENFVNQILEWTRSGSVRLKEYDLINIIEGLIYNNENQFQDRGVNVETNYEEGSHSLIADGIHLRQAIENIIINAIDAMPKGGSLKISTRLEPGYVFKRPDGLFEADAVHISIKDTGSGITPYDLDRIFRPFFTRKAKGTGLGLALVHKVVDMHNGEIRALSDCGKGSEFVITLPKMPAAG